ncbi:MAG: hypothetical protein RE471_04610 [Ferroplasma sp.]|uniref:hypothetical protein n=1 Tax=Ferroplasma sp. TaxID=2591003 RepID=UPI00281682AA|nr:hypothetical protein [Ferroplasma sp.]WMT52163.1 MAG: hypothetical protein RE471_04610 [Ferroplasma sp.]
MSEDNNGNRNSIKPIRSNVKLKNVKPATIETGKQKITGAPENSISEAKTIIDPFGIKRSSVSVREKKENTEKKNYFKH